MKPAERRNTVRTSKYTLQKIHREKCLMKENEAKLRRGEKRLIRGVSLNVGGRM